jgi:hypothetical protein
MIDNIQVRLRDPVIDRDGNVVKQQTSHYLRNKTSGIVYPWSYELSMRLDMEPTNDPAQPVKASTVPAIYTAPAQQAPIRQVPDVPAGNPFNVPAFHASPALPPVLLSGGEKAPVGFGIVSRANSAGAPSYEE